MGPRLEYVDIHVTAYQNRLLVGTVTFDLDGELIDKHFTFDSTEKFALLFDDDAWTTLVQKLQHQSDYEEMYNDLEATWKKRRQAAEWN